MMDQRLKPAYILSILIAVLAGVTSLGGLLLPNLYRDNAFVRTTWAGNDAVTLVLALPILIASLVRVRRGSPAALLVWMGSLDFMLYNYAFYLFAAAFNWFFLLYAALVGLSILALIFGLANLDVAMLAGEFRQSLPVRWIGGYFLFVAAGLTLIYSAMSIGFIASGKLPPIVVTSGHPTSIVFALDLTLLVPWLVLGAIWLMQRRPWGYVIAGALGIKAPLYTFILTINTILVARAGIGDAAELPIWVVLTVLGLVASLLLYVNMRGASTPAARGT